MRNGVYTLGAVTFSLAWQMDMLITWKKTGQLDSKIGLLARDSIVQERS
jgi:hypothetical protein